MPLTPRPLVYPVPRCTESRNGSFRLDESVAIALPESPSVDDLFLARSVAAHVVDRRQLALRTVRGNAVAAGARQIIMGDVRSPRVRAEAERLGLTPPAESPEGYVLDISETGILVAGTTARGAFYGMQSLRQILDAYPAGGEIPAVRIRDWPYKPFRALRLYLPGTENLAFFRRFIRDFAVYFKYNTLVIETNAAMRLDRHPELNAGWYEFARCLNYTRRDRPRGPGGEFQDSAHHDTGDFGVVEKDDVAGLVRCAAEQFMEVIPEIPFLTHSYYLLTRHRELAEIQAAEWPDSVCQQAPGAYELYFDVLDEYVEVMQPRTLHIGHDEWRMPVDVCPRCRGRDYTSLFVDDLQRIYARLQGKGLRLALWGDHLVEAVYGGPRQEWTSAAGRKYPLPGSISPRRLEQDIPRDILILNWFWNTSKKPVNSQNDALLSSLGFEQVFGNFTPEILEQEYARRSSQPGVLGGAVSSWSATSAFNFGKDLMYDFVGCAQLLWSDRWAPLADTAALVQAWMPVVRRNFRGAPTPFEDGEAATPLTGTVAPDQTPFGLPALRTGMLDAAGARFGLATGAPLAVAVVDATADAGAHPAVAVGTDVSSLVFLHACAVPAANHRGHTFIYNFPDTADLLGWYEITYADGFVATVPIRYGVNILEWSWPGRAGTKDTCIEADPVGVSVANSAPVTFFAHEWVNPRFGKPVRHVRLVGSHGFVSANGKPLGANTLVLLALTTVPRRPLSASAWRPVARPANAAPEDDVTAGAVPPRH